MSILDAIIQGVVQGLTEFLPVSSSGHLAITQHILGAGTGESNLFFNVMLHVGTLVAVVAFYHKLVWDLIKEFFLMLKDIFTGKFKWSKMNYNRNLVVMLIIGLIPLFLLFLPIPGTDMKLKDLADRLSASPVLIVTACSLILTSVLLTIGIIRNRKSVASTHKHLATKRDIEQNEVAQAVQTRINGYCQQLMKDTASGYSAVQIQNYNDKIDLENWNYTLLPVWVVTYKYRGKILPFAVNGQTGKTYGELPTSAGKLIAFAAIIAAVLMALGLLGGLLFL